MNGAPRWQDLPGWQPEPSEPYPCACGCGQPVVYRGIGRRPKFATKACRQNAHYARQKG